MLAVTSHGPLNIQVDDVPKPTLVEKTDAIVRVTTSALSQGISELERRIGIDLFERFYPGNETMKGQWAPIQTVRDLLTDDQTVANDMIIEVEGADAEFVHSAATAIDPHQTALREGQRRAALAILKALSIDTVEKLTNLENYNEHSVDNG